MKQIREGDIVARVSYQLDIIFVVKRLLYTKHGIIAILNGVTVRVQADAPIEDLQLLDKTQIKEKTSIAENHFLSKIARK